MNVIKPERSLQALIAAAVLQAVQDYRKEVFAAIEGHYPDYIIVDNNVIEQCERFFEDVGFSAYKSIKPGMLELRKLVDENKDKIEEKKPARFKCPICNGTVTLRMGNRIVSRFDKTKVVTKRMKRVSCAGCLFKSYIE